MNEPNLRPYISATISIIFLVMTIAYMPHMLETIWNFILIQVHTIGVFGFIAIIITAIFASVGIHHVIQSILGEEGKTK